jgi:hypothetical protein
MKRLLLLFVMVCALFLVSGKQSSAMAGYCPDFCYTGWEVYPAEGGNLWCCDIEQLCCWIPNSQ